MAAADHHHAVRHVPADRRAAADVQLDQGRIHARRPADPDWRPVRAGRPADERVAHCAAYVALHEAGAAEAHRAHPVDGADILDECGEFGGGLQV